MWQQSAQLTWREIEQGIWRRSDHQFDNQVSYRPKYASIVLSIQ